MRITRKVAVHWISCDRIWLPERHTMALPNLPYEHRGAAIDGGAAVGIAVLRQDDLPSGKRPSFSGSSTGCWSVFRGARNFLQKPFDAFVSAA